MTAIHNPTPSPQPIGLREKQAAKLLGVSARQLAQWRYDGRIRAAEFGRKCVIYSVVELERFLADNLTGGVEEVAG